MLVYVFCALSLTFVAETAVINSTDVLGQITQISGNLSANEVWSDDVNLPEEARFASFVIREKSFSAALFRKVNWYTAELYCASQGLTLASINTLAESEQMRRYLYEAGVLANNLNFWLSGTDLAEARNWYWFSSGRPLIYQNWDLNEPNAAGRCLVITTNGKWKAVDCASNNLFICENRCALETYNLPG